MAKKKVKAPKEAELALESKASIKGRALKLSLEESLSGGYLQDGKTKNPTLKHTLNARKVKNASKLGKFKGKN